MNIAEYIEQVLKDQRREKIWLADKLNITKQIMNYRFKNNNFSANELMTISKELGIDLNKLRDEI